MRVIGDVRERHPGFLSVKAAREKAADAYAELRYGDDQADVSADEAAGWAWADCGRQDQPRDPLGSVVGMPNRQPAREHRPVLIGPLIAVCCQATSLLPCSPPGTAVALAPLELVGVAETGRARLTYDC
jgi:hypothetical protein